MGRRVKKLIVYGTKTSPLDSSSQATSVDWLEQPRCVGRVWV